MKKIFLVDDDAVVIEIYRKKFLREGYTVEVAGDGLSAMKQLPLIKPDLVVLDLMMPKFDGAEVLRFIRATPALRHAKVVIFSNAYMTEVALAAAKVGADASLLKSSCTPAQLISVVKTLFESGGEISAPVPPPAASQITVPDPVRKIDLAARPLPVTPPPRQPIEKLEARVRDYFIGNGDTMLTSIRELSAAFAQAGELQGRAQRLADFHRQIHFFTDEAELAGCQRIAHLSAALEALLFELQERPKNAGPSSLRTIQSAIDLLGELFASAARGEPESITPTNLLAVLVVDDEPLANRALIHALNRASVKSTSACDATTALQLLQKKHYDLLLLDYLMPVMDGLELYDRAHAMPDYQTTPVIFVTSQAGFKEAHPEIIARGDDVITKPILPIELAVKSLTLLLKSRLSEKKTTPTT